MDIERCSSFPMKLTPTRSEPRKKPSRILLMKYWLFNDCASYFVFLYIIIPTTLGRFSSPKKQPTRSPFFFIPLKWEDDWETPLYITYPPKVENGLLDLKMATKEIGDSGFGNPSFWGSMLNLGRVSQKISNAQRNHFLVTACDWAAFLKNWFLIQSLRAKNTHVLKKLTQVNQKKIATHNVDPFELPWIPPKPRWVSSAIGPTRPGRSLEGYSVLEGESSSPGSSCAVWQMGWVNTYVHLMFLGLYVFECVYKYL